MLRRLVLAVMASCSPNVDIVAIIFNVMWTLRQPVSQLWSLPSQPLTPSVSTCPHLVARSLHLHSRLVHRNCWEDPS